MSSHLLAIETSNTFLSVAVQKAGGPVLESTAPGYLNHVENLIPSLDELLKKAGLALEDIACFLIDRGPGSFTGLRVGFATLKALEQVQKKDCYGALSLDMIAENCVLENGSKLAVCVDAHRNKLYVRFFERRKDLWMPLTDVELKRVSEVADHCSKETYLAGDGLSRYRSEFEKLKGNSWFQFLPQTVWYPKASSLISLFRNQRSKVQKLTQAADWIPLYLRLSEAEEKRQKNANVC